MNRILLNRIVLSAALFLSLVLVFVFQYNQSAAVGDTTPPTSQATINATRYGPSTFNVSGSINGVANDSSGVLQVALKIVRSGDNKFLNGSSWSSSESQLPTTLTGSGSVAWSFNASNFLASGLQDGTSYTVTPRATDFAGNTADGSPDSFVWDESLPAVTIASPSNGSTVNTTFNLNANSSENASCQFKQDSGTFGTYTTLLSTSHTKSLSGISTGSHTIQVRCTDEAGNVSSTATTSFTVSTNANTNSSSGGGSSNSNTNTNTNGSVPNQPVITIIAPSSVVGIKARDEKITCRAIDNNNVNKGFDLSKTKLTINGTKVNATITNINTNGALANTNTNGNANGNNNTNTNTNNSNNTSDLRAIEMNYIPNSSNLYAASTTIDVECEVWNNNNFRAVKSFQLSIGNGLSNSNTNASNANTNASNTNSATTNQNTNAPTTGSGSTFFNDTGSHWSKTYVEKLHTSCAVEGFKDAAGNLTHEFGPDKFITRAELIAMVLKCRKFDPAAMTSTDIPFPDVSASHWALKYILEGKNNGIIGGYPDGTFGADRPILRVEALKVILLGWLNGLDITGGSATFKDLVSGAWYIKYVNYAVLKGYVSGYKNADGSDSGEFRPGNNITRGEAAKIITNVMEKH